MNDSVLLSRVSDTMHITMHPKRSVTITINRLSLYLFEEEFIQLAKMVFEAIPLLAENHVGTVAQFDKGAIERKADGFILLRFLSIQCQFIDEGFERFFAMVERAHENYEAHYKRDTIDADILDFLHAIELQ